MMSRAQVIGRREEEENCLQKIKGKHLGCVTSGWLGSGSTIQDGESNEPTNPFPVWIHRFPWCTMIPEWSWIVHADPDQPKRTHSQGAVILCNFLCNLSHNVTHGGKSVEIDAESRTKFYFRKSFCNLFCNVSTVAGYVTLGNVSCNLFRNGIVGQVAQKLHSVTVPLIRDIFEQVTLLLSGNSNGVESKSRWHQTSLVIRKLKHATFLSHGRQLEVSCFPI